MMCEEGLGCITIPADKWPEFESVARLENKTQPHFHPGSPGSPGSQSQAKPVEARMDETGT